MIETCHDLELEDIPEKTGIPLLQKIFPPVAPSDGHTIKGLAVSQERSAGLFAVNKGTIKNVIVEGASVTSQLEWANTGAGAIVGLSGSSSSSIITGCYYQYAGLGGAGHNGRPIDTNSGLYNNCWGAMNTAFNLFRYLFSLFR